jgi:hypothetical protein
VSRGEHATNDRLYKRRLPDANVDDQVLDVWGFKQPVISLKESAERLDGLRSRVTEARRDQMSYTCPDRNRGIFGQLVERRSD